MIKERDIANICRYQLVGGGVSYVTRMVNGQVEGGPTGPSDNRQSRSLNRAVRRKYAMLATGDLPKFALLRTYPEHHSGMDPDLVVMGECRLCIHTTSGEQWLHEFPDICTVFNPAGTEYELSSPVFPGIRFRLATSLAGDSSIVAGLTISNTGEARQELRVSFHYGTMYRQKAGYHGSYLNVSKAVGGTTYTVTAKDGLAILTHPEIADQVAVVVQPAATIRLEGDQVLLVNAVTLDAGESRSLYLSTAYSVDGVAAGAELLQKDGAALIAENKRYYESLLHGCTIDTPDRFLDAAFQAAILNLEYCWSGWAWLEGISGWCTYFCDNYHMSAATLLGQFDRVATAFDFFNTKECGPSPMINADGRPYGDGSEMVFDEALPYYAYQLCEYYDHTGDLDTVRRVWPQLKRNLDLLWRRRDIKGHGLIGWRLHCNCFMYQADNLGLPGDAASPSIMMAGVARRLSAIAADLGDPDEAGNWKQRADIMHRNLDRILWDCDRGTFFNHIDLQDIAHTANYYTDMVFPVLYAEMSDEVRWQCLDYLNRKLVFDRPYRDSGLHVKMMTVGNFKPKYFGNDFVGVTQMAEAARAFLRGGDGATGSSLLTLPALSSTVCTESPGMFMEGVAEDGTPSPNWGFSNPAASFLLAVADGVFGTSLVNRGLTFAWHPCFPEPWDHAALRLPFASVTYARKRNGGEYEVCYKAELPVPKTLAFRTFIPAGRIVGVWVNGQEQSYTATPAPGMTRIGIEAATGSGFQIVLRYVPEKVGCAGCRIGEAAMGLPEGGAANFEIARGERAVWAFTHAINRISDPQKLLGDATVSGCTLEGVVTGRPGHHLFYVYFEAPQTVVSVSVEVTQKEDVRTVPPGPIPVDAREVQLDISRFCNTNSVFASSNWLYRNIAIDLTPYINPALEIDTGYGSFIATPGEKPIAMVSLGLSDLVTRETKPSGFANRIAIPVNANACRVKLLYISEFEARVTGATVGEIVLNYHGGCKSLTPLVVGKNIGNILKYCGEETRRVKAGKIVFDPPIPGYSVEDVYAHILEIPCDASVTLASIGIDIMAADVQLGLLGVNVFVLSTNEESGVARAKEIG